MEILRLPESIHILFYIGLLFLLSQIFGRIANYLKAPRIIGYLLCGIVFGPAILGIFSKTLVTEKLSIMTDIALAFIAYSIGGALRLDRLLHLKRSISLITLLQAFAATAIVTVLASLTLPLFTASPSTASFWSAIFPIALVLGAISAATAPAAIVSILHEYRATGTFTTILLGVVALDDALTIVFYAFAVSVAMSIATGSPLTLSTAFLWPIGSIICALVIGAGVGIGRRALLFLETPKLMLGLAIGAILLTSGLAISLGLSPLLATMMLGFVIRNFVEKNDKALAFEVIKNIEEPIFGLFFALAGAHLDMEITQSAILFALILMGGRFAGKISGTYIGALVAGAPDTIKKYLGLSLLPSAGVTVGLMLSANALLSAHYPNLCKLMVSAIIAKTLMNELLTPFLLRYSLRKVGDI